LAGRERVTEYLPRSGVAFEPTDLRESTKDSSLAVQALGRRVAEMAKSGVFVGRRTAAVIISGTRGWTKTS
jgi:hypothetical protein